MKRTIAFMLLAVLLIVSMFSPIDIRAAGVSDNDLIPEVSGNDWIPEVSGNDMESEVPDNGEEPEAPGSDTVQGLTGNAKVA